MKKYVLFGHRGIHKKFYSIIPEEQFNNDEKYERLRGPKKFFQYFDPIHNIMEKGDLIFCTIKRLEYLIKHYERASYSRKSRKISKENYYKQINSKLEYLRNKLKKIQKDYPEYFI